MCAACLDDTTDVAEIFSPQCGHHLHVTAAFSHAVRASSDFFLGNRASGPNTHKNVQYKIKSQVNTYRGEGGVGGGVVLCGSYLFLIKIIIDVNTNSV